MGDKKRFYLIDKKFKQNKKQYILQCLLAAVSISAILIALNAFFNAAVIAAFGATCFIVFAMPNQKTSNLRRLIGGYIIGIAVGVGLRFLLQTITPELEMKWLISFGGAMAVAISIFLMTITNSEHPPAAGVALGIALEGIEPVGIFILFIAVCVLAIIKVALRKWMIDLFE